MAIDPLALFSDPDIVWESLCVEQEDRIKNAHVMERWINAASALMESILNRPVMPRDVLEEADGTGRPTIQTEDFPLIQVHNLTVYDPDFSNFDIIRVDPEPLPTRECAIKLEEGRIVLLPDAPISRFTRGVQNVHINYRVGFQPGPIAVIQEAAIELIQQRWEMLGRNPVEKVRADSINTIATFTLADFDQLPFMARQAVDHFRRRQV